jgi:WD40 repeat protein
MRPTINKHIQLAGLAASLALAAVSPAQQVRQQALGFVVDSGISRVRPIWGVPGASLIGDSIDLGSSVSSIAASPKQDFLVFVGGSTKSARIWMHDTQVISAVSGVVDGAAKVVLSPEGTSAAFYYADINRIHVVSGLPEASSTSMDVDLSALMNPLRSLAVSDDGALLLASESFVSGNAAPAVVVFNSKGAIARIPLSSSATAITFLSNSHDVLLSATSESVLIRDAAVQGSRIALSAEANSAVGIIASTDGARALFANPDSGTVSIFSLNSAGSPPAVINCSCVPTGIARTSNASIYRLTEDAGVPVSLLDLSSNQPRVLVTPPLVAVENPQGNQ